MRGMLAPALQTPSIAGALPSRRARWAAVALDAAAGLGLALLLYGLGAAWLLVRTGGGERDVGSGDGTLAFALLMAAVPGWLAWLGFALFTGGATPGQRARGLAVAGTPWRRVLRLAIHPLGACGWFWLAAVAQMSLLPAVSLLLTAIGFVVLASGLASVVLTLRRRGARGVHDRIASTYLALRPTPASSGDGEP